MRLCDHHIRHYCASYDLIKPFTEAVSGNGIVSYGLTSAGYDVRLDGKKIYVFKNSYGAVVDPKAFGDAEYHHKMFDELTDLPSGYRVFIPPNGYILGQTYEYIRIPRHVSADCVGKSTYARSGILINTTPMEPEWEGHLTLEIANLTPCPAVIYVMEGIAQFRFETLSGVPEISYADKKGKYQGQQAVTPAKVL